MAMNKTIGLYVGGTFDDGKGRFSSIADTIYQALQPADMDYYNGGCFSQLESLIERIREYSLIFWFANVQNDKPKIVKQIKAKHSSCLLITSKRNDGRYSAADIIHHALD